MFGEKQKLYQKYVLKSCVTLLNLVETSCLYILQETWLLSDLWEIEGEPVRQSDEGQGDGERSLSGRLLH